MRFTFALVVVVLVGCGQEPETQECKRLGKVAAVAVDAYVRTRHAEQDRLDELHRQLADRFDVANDQMKLLFKAPGASSCGYVVGLASLAQPTEFMLEVTRGRMFRAIQAGRELLRLAGPDLVLPPGTATDVTRAVVSFELVSERWSDIMKETPVRPGRRWSATQRTYLTALEAAWCDLARVVTEVIEPRLDVVRRESRRLGGEYNRAFDAAWDHRSVTNHSPYLQADLARDPPRPVAVPPEFEEDPAFAAFWPAIKAYNLCRQ